MLLGQSRSLKNHVKIYTSNANESKDVKTASHLATPKTISSKGFVNFLPVSMLSGHMGA
jgi:hypothetical protein